MYGQMFITDKIEDIQSQIANSSTAILLLVDEAEAQQFQYTGCLSVGVLLPPFESLDLEINGKQVQSDQVYYAYLNDPMRQKVFATIIAALRMGKNICFYVPHEQAMNLHFVSTFIGYVLQTFGIGIADGIGVGYNPEPFIDPNPNMVANRLNLMYMYDTIDIYSFAAEYPDNMYPSMNVANKIFQLYNGINMLNVDQNYILNFVYSYIYNIKHPNIQSNSEGMHNILIREQSL